MSDGKDQSRLISAWRKTTRQWRLVHSSASLLPSINSSGVRPPGNTYRRTWVHNLTGQRLFQVYKGRNAWKRARATT